MLIHIRRVRDDERGMSLVFVAVGLMSFMAATTLAIDVGMVMTSRGQAQNSADAGALAGATAFVFDSYDDRSSGGPVVRSAMSTAAFNEVMHGPVSITPADVTFPVGPSGASNRVKVTVFRTAERANPVTTLMANIFGVSSVDVVATATAESAPANAASCVAPFAIPDRWTERQTPTWDPNDTFNAFPANPSLQPDVYHAAAQQSYTGYDATTDRGLRLTIREIPATNITGSFYFSLALAGSSGGSDYSQDISSCNPSAVHFGELLTAQPNMAVPMSQGIQDLIAQDPSAYWDTATNRVVSAMNPSPRVKIVPVFDPYYWNVGKMGGSNTELKAANFIGFFIEGMSGNDVIGRITPVTGMIDGGGPPAPENAFPRAIRLVQ